MRYLLFILFLAFSLQVPAQKVWKKQADAKYERGAYAKSIPLYEKYLKKKPQDYDAAWKLAESYRLTRQYDAAGKWYEILKNSPEKNPGYYFSYGHLLLEEGKLSEATEMFQTFAQLAPDDPRGPEFLEQLQNMERLYVDSGAFIIENLPFNSPETDFGAAPYLDGIVFASARDTGGAVVRKFEGDGGFFLDLFFVREDEDSSWTRPKSMKGDLNSRFHESSFSAASDSAGEAWFSRNNFHRNKKGKSAGKMILLKVYRARMKKLRGTKIEPFSWNSDEYSLTHPAISPDGNTLFMVSDMPGGKGGKDIYYATRNGDQWSEPVNYLAVNTAGDEVFPFVDEKGELYFSSNGQGGMGNLDIFHAEQTGEDVLVKNLGYPLNSSADDFAYSVLPGGTAGYFSSNRPGGKGQDDIYRFLKMLPRLRLAVTDSISGFPVENVEIRLSSPEGTVLSSILTDSLGEAVLDLGRGEYKLDFYSTDFVPLQRRIDTRSESGQLEFEKSVHLYNPPPALTALVVDDSTRKILNGASITLFNQTLQDSLVRISDRYGRFSVKLDRNCNYEMTVRMPGYLTYKGQLSTTFDNFDGDTIIPMKMEAIRINKVVTLNHVHYAFDRWDIRDEDKPDLLALGDLLKDNPDIRIELASHTDSRGTDTYNLSLSQKRADSAREFLLKLGIDPSRIESKGYGEQKLLNNCADGVNCPEEDHFLNRRTEFRIIGFVEGVEIEYRK